MILPTAVVDRLARLCGEFGLENADELIARAVQFLDTVATVRQEGGSVAVKFRDGSSVDLKP